MARMRIISEAYRQILADDPETAITKSALRRIISSGVVPTVRVGRKVLVNYDRLLDYLSIPTG